MYPVPKALAINPVKWTFTDRCPRAIVYEESSSFSSVYFDCSRIITTSNGFNYNSDIADYRFPLVKVLESTEDFPENPLSMFLLPYPMALNSTPYPPPARTSRPGGLWILSNPQTIDIPRHGPRPATSENTTVARGTSENSDTRYRIVRVKSVMDPLRLGGEGSYLLIEWSATYPRGEKRSKDSQIHSYDQKGNTSIIEFIGSLLDGFAVHGPVWKAF